MQRVATGIGQKIALIPPAAFFHAGLATLVAYAALAWYDRDAAAGEGEMPYPPEYPKMPGEPPRVQPSRARQQPGEASG